MTFIWNPGAPTGGGGAGPTSPPVSVGPTAPTTATVGDLWLDTSAAPATLKLYGAGNTWEPVAPETPKFTVGATAPTGAVVGDFWIDTTGGAVALKAMTAANTWTLLQGLDTSGKIDKSILGFEPQEFKGSLDVTVAYTAPTTNLPQPGDFALVAKNGIAHASWAAVGVSGHQDAGNMMVWDGTKWDVIEHAINLNPTVDVRPVVAGQTQFVLGHEPAHDLWVSINGVTMVPGEDYTRAGDTITFPYPLTAGDTFEARYF